MHLFRSSILFLLVFLGGGCSSGEPDFCSLLSMDEVAELDAGVVASKMGVRGKRISTRYCIYTNRNDEDVFLLSIGTATKNLPYTILQTYSQYMEGVNTVRTVVGVGDSAAALFSDDYETDKFRILIANGDKWSATVRARGIRAESSPKFNTVKELANKALSRF